MEAVSTFRRQTLPVPNFQQGTPMCWGDDAGAYCMNELSAIPYRNAAASNCTKPEVIRYLSETVRF